MRKLISILNPVYWTTAQEVGEAVNGYTLTGGTFRRETQVEFATGAKLLIQLYEYCIFTNYTCCLKLLIVSVKGIDHPKLKYHTTYANVGTGDIF